MNQGMNDTNGGTTIIMTNNTPQPVYGMTQPMQPMGFNQPYQPAYQPIVQPSYQQNMQPAYQPNMQPTYQTNMQPTYQQPFVEASYGLGNQMPPQQQQGPILY